MAAGEAVDGESIVYFRRGMTQMTSPAETEPSLIQRMLGIVVFNDYNHVVSGLVDSVYAVISFFIIVYLFLDSKGFRSKICDCHAMK